MSRRLQEAGNNFDFVRLLAASLVIVGHAFPIMGREQPTLASIQISVLGVIIFFSISGYLIAGSWLADPHPLRYLAKRALRIFPGLALVVVLSAAVLGPLSSRLSMADYVANENAWIYLSNIALYIRYNLPAVFEGNPIPNAVNGSLWSLPAEFFMYLVLPALLALSRRTTPLILLVIAYLFALAADQLLHRPGVRWVVYGTEVRAVFHMATFFMVGAFLYGVRRLHRPNRWGALLLLAAALAASQLPARLSIPLGAMLNPITIAYLVIACGMASTPGIRRVGRFGDISYGLYLYAFPIQQLIAWKLLGQISLGMAMLLAWAGAAALAFGSWHLVEKRMLTLKPKQPTPRQP